jgi:hypothetical protein
MTAERARELYGFDQVEVLLMDTRLAEVERRLLAEDRPTVPPPRPVSE